MSMLAEPRRKVRWVLNPRETAWSNDATKFGQKYLEKLGWKTGQGIGANLQGCTEHVKVSVRSDNRGVGFKGIPEDALPHQNDFSDLLTQLATASPPLVVESNEERSLVVKSQKSKARVHYHKFTRSKDLTMYSPKDLACILGKPARPGVDAVPVDTRESVLSEPNFVHGGNMKDYFSGKMKGSCKNFVKENDDKCQNDNSYTGFGFNKGSDDSPNSQFESERADRNDEPSKTNNNLNKSRAYRGSTEELDSERHLSADCMETMSAPNSKDEPSVSDKKSKKKRRTYRESVEEIDKSLSTDCVETMTVLDQQCSKDELNASDKKSKKKRITCHESLEEHLSADCVVAVSIPEQPSSKDKLNVSDKKSKKKQKYLESAEDIDNKSLLVDCMTIPTPEQPCSNDELIVRDRKSKKKLKNVADCIEAMPIPVSVTTNKEESNGIDEKLRKKRKRQRSGDGVHVTDCTESKQIDKSEEEYVNTFRKKRKVEGCSVDTKGESLPTEVHGSEDREQLDETERTKSKNKKRKRAESEDIAESVHESDSSKASHLMGNEEKWDKKKLRKNKKYSCIENVECQPVSSHKDCPTESIRLLGRTVKVSDNHGTASSTEPSQPTYDVDSLGNEEKEFENIKISKKKKERIDKVVDAECEDEVYQTSRNVEDKDLNANFNKTKKKRKKKNETEEENYSRKCVLNGDCELIEGGASLDYVEYTSESAGTLEKEQVSNEHESQGKLKKSKKRKNINGESIETRQDDMCLPLVYGTESMHPVDSDKRLKKKVKKNTVSSPDEWEPDAISANGGQETKSVRFTNPLSRTVLIPSRVQLEEETKADQVARVLAKHKTHFAKGHRHVIYLKNTSLVSRNVKTVCGGGTEYDQGITKYRAVVKDRWGTEYVNGISKFKRVLERRLEYAFDAAKFIPKFQRSGAFDYFPGANVEQLGYGVPNTTAY